MDGARFVVPFSNHAYMASVHDVSATDAVEVSPDFYGYLRQRYHSRDQLPRVYPAERGASLVGGVRLQVTPSNEPFQGVKIPYYSDLFEDVDEGAEKPADAVVLDFEEDRLGEADVQEFDYTAADIASAMDDLAEKILDPEKSAGLGAR